MSIRAIKKQLCPRTKNAYVPLKTHRDGLVFSKCNLQMKTAKSFEKSRKFVL